MKFLTKMLLLIAALFLSLSAIASELEDNVLMVAQSRQTTQATIYGSNAEIVYVGQFSGCDSVSVKSHGNHFQHFRVCGGQIQPRNSVAPKWSNDNENKRVLSAVVKNAILYGQSSQIDTNGYLISARTLGTVEASCKNVEVVISYDGDLVDRAVKKICG